jgi:hypothetical protein
MFLNGMFIEFIRITFHDSKRIVWALAQAGTEAVAVHFGNELRLSIHNLQCSLCARWDALATAVTQVIVDFYNFPCNFHFFLLILQSSLLSALR